MEHSELDQVKSDQLHLFDAFGIELEYMLVDRETLNVIPAADKLFQAATGIAQSCEYVHGATTWSNELALHVVELKTTHPAKKLRQIPLQFEQSIRDLQKFLGPLNLRLLPTAMHPWMQPAQESELWPHESSEIYQAYHRIFDCHTHGWSNVQSVHLNLPFCGDDEFACLHAAVRLVLPLLPALTASSPVTDGVYSGHLDTRLRHYFEHCHVVPFLTGDLIPEAIFDEATYREQIFQRLYRDMQAHDPQGILQHEFLNARGAIARFDRGSIELRVMDVQEYPGADVAICAAVISLIKQLVKERWSSLQTQQSFSSERLRAILEATSEQGENARIEDAEYLSMFGIQSTSCKAKKLWQRILEPLRTEDVTLNNLFAPLEIILEKGTLATRIRTALGETFDREELTDVYDQLADCLDQWEPFSP